VECVSALERRRREGSLDRKLYDEARSRLARILEELIIVEPHPTVRGRAERLLAMHPLRAADALQLAAALVACDERPQGQSFVCLDARLRQAADKEGFACLPETSSFQGD
jgi:predicted nucleic acid-binding protein